MQWNINRLRILVTTIFVNGFGFLATIPPFMTLVRKEGCEYADGGLGSMVPIEEAIKGERQSLMRLFCKRK